MKDETATVKQLLTLTGTVIIVETDRDTCDGGHESDKTTAVYR